MSVIAHLLKPKPRDIGDFDVLRVLPAIEARSVGPFIFFDHFGPVDIPPGGGMDVRPHPHIGLATVTYLFAGEILHRDSLGFVQPIAPGDVNWMTAGRGIVHSERTAPELRAKGFRLHGIQSWVALPKDAEEVEPSFHHHPSSTLPEWTQDGVALKVVAGTAFGREAPVKVFAPTLYVAAVFEPGAVLDLPSEHEERAAYVASGSLTAEGEAVAVHQMAVFEPGATLRLRAGAEGAYVMLLGGARLDGPRHLWWNFVSSSKERIEKAKDDWRAMALGTVPGDDEFIPCRIADMIDNNKIDAVLAQMGRPKKVPRPHRHFDGEFVAAPTGKVAYTAEGAGPVVLLVHGWDGSPRDLQDIATALSRAGTRIVALDLPGHGLSDGEKITPEDAAAAILAVAAKEGPFECVIAHSFGCPSTVLALEGGLKTAALVFFAPPLRQIDQFRRLGGRFGLNDEEIEEIIARQRAAGSSMDRMNLDEKAQQRTEPLLIIHSEDDEMTPIAGARGLAAAWPKAKIIEAEGLGHNLTMRDPAMVAAAVRFAVG